MAIELVGSPIIRSGLPKNAAALREVKHDRTEMICDYKIQAINI